MLRLSAVVGVAFLGAAFLVGTGMSQDKKDKDKDKIKGMLPPGWKKLDLSKDQISKIYEVQTKYRGDFKKLEDQINELKTKERADMVKLLTEDQKELLRKLTIGEEKKDKEVKKDKGDKEKS